LAPKNVSLGLPKKELFGRALKPLKEGVQTQLEKESFLSIRIT